MKVSSPVGDFPFTPESLRVEGTDVVVEGAMGAWPATIRMGTEDVPMLLRLVPRPVLYAVAALVAVVLIRSITRGR